MDNSYDSKTLAGRTALVCGASQGIGAAAAKALAQMGCQVVALARGEDKLARVVATLSGSGHRALALDLANLEMGELQKLLSETPVHILVNNSGGPPSGPITEATPHQFEEAFHGHVAAAQRLAQLVLPGMKAAGYGRIINVISTSVKIPLPNLGVSNTIRASMANWAKTWAMEVGVFGITVNNVLPGYIETQRLASLIEGAAQKSGVSTEQMAEQWRATVPAKRFGRPEEMAAAIAFLASPQASYINGINLPVDGGRTGSL